MCKHTAERAEKGQKKKFRKCVKLTETRRDRDARRERTKRAEREREGGERVRGRERLAIDFWNVNCSP